MNMRALVLYPKYGMVNRLRAIASAGILADYTGRKLFVNWDPSKECNSAWEDLFVNKLERYPFPLSSFQNGMNLYDDENNADGFYWDMPRSLICNNADVVAVHTCLNFQPEEMTNEAYNNAKATFYRSLQPLHDVEKAVNEIYRRYFEGNNVVGVHIRRTDHFASTKKDSTLVCPTELFLEAIRKNLKNNDKTKVFLATDNKKEEKHIRQIFGDAVIVYEKDIVSRDTKRGMQDALIDWLLLSKTSRIIGSYSSSFSEEAGVVNMIEIKPVLREEELSKLHYKTIFKAHLKTHGEVLKKEGLYKYLLYAYTYRKGQIVSWFRDKI
jgi:hypothetical protein